MNDELSQDIHAKIYSDSVAILIESEGDVSKILNRIKAYQTPMIYGILFGIEFAQPLEDRSLMTATIKKQDPKTPKILSHFAKAGLDNITPAEALHRLITEVNLEEKKLDFNDSLMLYGLLGSLERTNQLDDNDALSLISHLILTGGVSPDYLDNLHD